MRLKRDLVKAMGMWARLLTSQAQIYLVQGAVTVPAANCRVSLAALSPRIEGLTLKGMEYSLEGAELKREQTLGLAYAALGEMATVEFSSGELLP